MVNFKNDYLWLYGLSLATTVCPMSTKLTMYIHIYITRIYTAPIKATVSKSVGLKSHYTRRI